MLARPFGWTFRAGTLHLLGLGEERVEESRLDRRAHFLRLREPLLALLGRDALPQFNERELSELKEARHERCEC